MAIFIPQYSPAMSFLDSSQIGDIANNTCRRGGGFGNTGIKATDMAVFLRLRLASAPNSGGSIDIHLATSVDGQLYTDNLPVTYTVGVTITPPQYSRLLVSIPAYTTIVTWQGSILDYLPSLPPVFNFLLVNRSGSPGLSHADNILYGRYIGYEYA